MRTQQMCKCTSRQLDAEKLHPEDMLGLYEVSQNDTTYQVFLANDEALNFLLYKMVITNGRSKFSVTRMSEQVVKVKVHWLPIYYDNRIVNAMLCDYGEIMNIHMCKSSYANVVAMNRMREVTTRTTEVRKQPCHVLTPARVPF